MRKSRSRPITKRAAADKLDGVALRRPPFATVGVWWFGQRVETLLALASRRRRILHVDRGGRTFVIIPTQPQRGRNGRRLAR